MLNIFENYNVIFFDLDDTLYPEIAYLKAAFNAIGHFSETQYALNAQQVEEFLTTNFIKNGRQNLFNQCFIHFEAAIRASKRENNEGVVLEAIFVAHCLNILRTVQIREKICLYPFVHKLIPELIKQEKQIFIITNGNITQQKNKIKHLEWNDIDTSVTVVFANQFAPKPSPKVFTDFLEPNFNLKNKCLLFVGDAETDEAFSRNIGANFLHVDYFK